MGKEDRGVVHFIGICGAGMAGIARLMRSDGWAVSGSDAQAYPPVSDQLKAEGLPCIESYDPANIPDEASLIVIGKHANLTPERNEEVRHAFELQAQGRVRIHSFPEVLREMTHDKHRIVVAGSYGKSTTTALLAWALREAGLDTGYFIGAVPRGLPGSADLGTAPYFVFEGDEYPSANWDPTPKFCYYNAQTLILTSTEHDHYNVYPTEESYRAPFESLVASMPPDGLLIACLDGDGVEPLLDIAACPYQTYSARIEANADWTARDIVIHAEGSTFTLLRRGTHGYEQVTQIKTPLLGRHNCENMLGVCAAILARGLMTPEQLAVGMRTFQGLRRRLESKTERSTVRVYEDLASSRPKAAACLQTLREAYPDRRIVAVFQPHTFSFRTRAALGWYDNLFVDVDHVVLCGVPEMLHGHNEDEAGLQDIFDAIRSAGGSTVSLAQTQEETVAQTLAALGPTDVVILMTSGDLLGAIPPLVVAIEARFPAL